MTAAKSTNTYSESLESIDVEDIVLGWNSRKVQPKDGDGAEGKSMRASMVERIGKGLPPNHTPIKVRKVGDKYSLVFGSRRLAEARTIYGKKGGNILAIVASYPGSDADGEKQAAIDNITENAQREDLQPWERAEAFADLKSRFKDFTDKELAKKTGFSDRYISNLLRLRAKLAPDLWEAYKQGGDTMRQADLLAVCSKKKEEQAEAYNELVKERKGGRPQGKGGKTPEKGATQKPGSKDQFEEVPLAQLLAETRKAKGQAHPFFLEGLAYALQVCNGKMTWNLEKVIASGQYPVPEGDEDDEEA